MKKVLVTGASGFVGQYVVEALLQKGYQVIATSSNITKGSAFPWFEKVEYMPLDYREMDMSKNYFQYFNQPDLLIHLAWEGLPDFKGAFHTEENLPRHLHLLKNLLQNGLTDITVTGTCLEYGMQEGCLREDMDCKPAIAYPIAKNELRKELEGLQASSGFHFKWLRLFYMYGKGQHPKSLIPQLERALQSGEESFNMSGGEQVRDFLPVEKVAEYIVAAALQKSIEGIINCCSGQPVTVKQFVEDYLRSRQASIRLNTGFYPYADYEPMAFWGDTGKLSAVMSGA